jgi:hypothetical protein
MGLYPVFAEGSLQLKTWPYFETWNAVSPVTAANPVESPPALWGPSPTFVGDNRRVTQGWLRIDEDAGTAA